MIGRLFRIELDLRALAALRISLGTLLLVDVLLRLPDLSAFLTDDGVLPRRTLLEIPHPTYLNLFLTVGSEPGAAFWLLLLALASLGMIVGWQTRWCTVAAWALFIALKARNPLILHAGDLELGLILGWAIFLPMSARFSVDARANPDWANLPDSYSSVATTGYLLQLSLMYAMAALHKTDPVWWESGLALYYCFSYDIFATPLAKTLSADPLTLRYPTYIALALEAAIPLLLWIPWRRSFFRGLGCIVIVAFHLAIAVTMNLGLMPAINIGMTLGLWPGRIFGSLFRGARCVSLPHTTRGACPGVQLSRPTQLLLGLGCLYIIHLNVAVYRGSIVSKPIKLFGYYLRLQQEWKLFAPHPGVSDGWFVIKGECVDGSEVTLPFPGTAASLEKPSSVAALFPNQRWRIWLLNLRDRNDERVNATYATWIAKSWNRDNPGPKSVKALTLIFVSEPTPLPGQPILAKPLVHYRFECPKELYQSPNRVYLPLSPP